MAIHCLHLSPAQTPHPSPPRHAVSHFPSEPRRSPDSIGSKSLPLTTLPRHPRGVAWAVVWRVGRQAEAKLGATVRRTTAGGQIARQTLPHGSPDILILRD